MRRPTPPPKKGNAARPVGGDAARGNTTAASRPSNNTMPKPRRPFVVVTRKANGAEVIFTKCADQRAADLVVMQLAAIGLSARAEPARHDDVPGLTRRPAVARP